jgi:zinc transport system substrate-binding protein
VKGLLVLLIGMCCMIGSCSPEPDQSRSSSKGDKPVVYTVNYPLAYFAQRIGGDFVDVHFPGPIEEDPAYWQPDSATIAQYQSADMILLNGAGYAKWMEMVSLPTSRCVNTSSAFKDQYIELDDDLTHSHGPAGEHAHGGLAFTTWLDFSLAAQQAQAIKDALVKGAPEHTADFEANCADLAKDLLLLDAEMKTVAAKIKDTPLVVSHPVYQYWARGYGLNVRSVHWEPDEVPNDAQWSEFRKMLIGHPSQWMIWEGNSDAETVDALKALQIQSITFDPCGARPAEKDFLYSMRHNIQELKKIL